MLMMARSPGCDRQDAGDSLVEAFARTRAELVATLTRMLGNREDALDAVQTAFLKCWQTRSRLDGVRDLNAWVFRVGLNAGRDLRRDAWRRRSRPLLAAPHRIAAVSNKTFDDETLDLLREALATLRPGEREVFLLRQHSDHTYDEIASLCCIPVGTVKTRMRTAIIKLRVALLQPA